MKVIHVFIVTNSLGSPDWHARFWIITNEMIWPLNMNHFTTISRYVYPTNMITYNVYPCWGACNNIQGFDRTAMIKYSHNSTSAALPASPWWWNKVHKSSCWQAIHPSIPSLLHPFTHPANVLFFLSVVGPSYNKHYIAVSCPDLVRV